MSPAPRAILFDLDETIITAGRRPEQLARVAEGYVPPGADLTAAALAQTVEIHMVRFWADPARHREWRFKLVEARRLIVAEAFAELTAAGAPGLTIEAAHQFADAFNALREAHQQLFPGALEALDALRAKAERLVLITNGPGAVQRAKVERFDLDRRFDYIQIEGECGFGKPEPRAYRHALAAVGAMPDTAWIVGDNLDWEVAAAQKLGLYAVWCDPHGLGLPTDSPVRPDRIIRSLTELPPLL